MLLAALLLRLIFGDDGLLGNMVVFLRDLGFGFIEIGGYFWLKKIRPKPFLITGIILIGLWSSMELVTILFSDDPPETKAAETQEFLLELGPDDDIDEVKSLLSKYDATFEKAFPNVDILEDEDLAQVFLVSCPKNSIKDLMGKLVKDRENVDHVELNAEVKLVPTIKGKLDFLQKPSGITNDPLFSNQWYFDVSHFSQVLPLIGDSTKIGKATVAIVDTGVDSKHEDLRNIFQDSPGDTDPNGHGTHCAGIAGAEANNGVGIASLNWEGDLIRIKGYKALSASGRGTTESVAQEIINATEDGADVISLSLGGYSPTTPKITIDAIEYAQKHGIIVVVAAGNSDDDAKFYSPANVQGIIVVSAIDSKGKKASFSNTNTSLKMPIAAPGVDIFSLGPNGNYLSLSGTSMATPMVAGLIGIMRTYNSKLTAKEAYKILHSTGTRGPDADQVGNSINGEAALRTLIN